MLPSGSKSNTSVNIFKGFLELKKVLHQLKDLTTLRRYLRAFFIYSMGVQTVMLMATLFGKKEITGMPDSGLIISVLLIQFVAVGGAVGRRQPLVRRRPPPRLVVRWRVAARLQSPLGKRLQADSFP